MKHTITGNKYAIALFQLALENNEVDKLENDLRVVKEVFESTPELTTLLQSPNVSKEHKKATVTEAFASLSPFIINTLQLLIERHRVEHITPMVEKFIELSLDRKGIAEATVESVRPLTDVEKATLSSVFAQKINKSALEIQNNINSDLLGGLKIQIGNRIYDGSLRGKLDRLKRELVGYQS
ncbi:F0F1 ATP synthase subunit delta [Caldibacillus lycopersici]|uniref:ATP synthase subunit delta n=1 Tax=Perspicuibacillus lycopersici TaxID=1325689 RepID=A0AAE3LQB4_9BACI|nr:F0F1 ATP synthase subunit delta [Perspicuibacillus lycopersici]MCU9613299.1 F0F1 ATP synthase subunit delta [Perspicuibacillus lycopersici]